MKYKLIKIKTNISVEEVVSLARTRLYGKIKRKIQEHPLSRIEFKEIIEVVERLAKSDQNYLDY